MVDSVIIEQERVVFCSVIQVMLDQFFLSHVIFKTKGIVFRSMHFGLKLTATGTSREN